MQEEFAKLLTEKKAAYPELKKARDEMRELLTVNANVERMLGEDERERTDNKKAKNEAVKTENEGISGEICRTI